MGRLEILGPPAADVAGVLTGRYMRNTGFKTYFDDFLGEYPANPSQAYWRAIEASLLQEEDYPAPLLDLGCGDGSFAAVFFGRLGLTPDSACDISAAKTARAEARGIYREVRTADITALPYADSSFSAVFSNCVLEHIPGDARAVGEAARVLRPGGRMVFTVPSEKFMDSLPPYKEFISGGEEDKARDYAARMDKRLEHHHYRPPSEWAGLLAACGMRMVKVVYYLSPAEEALWSFFLSLEDRAAKLPGPFNAVFRFLFKTAGRLFLRPKPGNSGGALLIVAEKEG